MNEQLNPPRTKEPHIYGIEDIVILDEPIEFLFREETLLTRAIMKIQVGDCTHDAPVIQIGEVCIAFIDLHHERNPQLCEAASQEMAALLNEHHGLQLALGVQSSKSETFVTQAARQSIHQLTPLFFPTLSEPPTDSQTDAISYTPITTPQGKYLIPSAEIQFALSVIPADQQSTIALIEDVVSSGATSIAVKDATGIPNMVTYAFAFEIKADELDEAENRMEQLNVTTPRIITTIEADTQIGEKRLGDYAAQLPQQQ